MTFEPAPNSPARKPINPVLKLALELGRFREALGEGDAKEEREEHLHAR